MKGRILSIAIALSLIAMVFAAVPMSTEAAVYYEGTVQTTDNEGELKDSYIQGERVYVSVETFYMGVNGSQEIRLELIAESGPPRDWFEAETADPEGTYESWTATPSAQSLSTSGSFSGDSIVYDVVLYVNVGGMWTIWEEVARTPITVTASGLTLAPEPMFTYYPGQEIQISIVTTHAEDFYIQVVNDTAEDFYNLTNQDPTDGITDGFWSGSWTIPLDIPDDWYWMNVRQESDHTLWYSVSFTIQKYALMVDADRQYVLPGETVDITYDVVDIATMSHSSSVTLEWNAVYNTSDDDNGTWQSGELPQSSGVFTYEVPLDIALWSDIDMTFWANESDDRTADATLWMTIGVLGGDLNVNSGPYQPGEAVLVTASASVDWESLDGADVDVTVEKNGTVIAAYGVSGLVTDIAGVAEYEFTLSSGATEGTYIVKATISKLGYEIERWDQFEVAFTGSLTVQFDKEYYLSGQTATFTFEAIWNNQALDGVSVYYIIYDDGGMVSSGNSTDGTGSYDIPDEYVGGLDVDANAILNGNYMWSWDDTTVIMADVMLAAENEIYRPGDTLTFVYHIATLIANASLTYTIVNDDGVYVATGSVPFAEAGSFEYQIPESDTSTSYTATLTMVDGVGHVESASASSWLYASHEIQIWIKSGSGYVSRAFEPGATVEFGYSITTVGVEHLDVYRIVFEASGDWSDRNIFVTEATGTFEYVVPDTQSDGSYWMYAYLYDPVMGGGSLSSDSTSFSVQTDQSVWDKSVAGLSIFNVLVLVLLVLLFVVLIVMPFVKARQAMDEGPKPRSMEHEVPPPADEPGEVPPPTS